jgi:ribosomal protein L11 methyltransferase
LLAIDRLTRGRTFANVLDLGTGSGILALALKRALPQARIMASDIDRRSIEVAGDNARQNGLGERAGGPRFIVADGLGDPRLRRAQPFDLIVANILAAPLIAIADEVVGALGTGATLVLSGLLAEQAWPVAMRYRSLGLRLARQAHHHGWSTLVLERPGHRPTRPQAAPFNLCMPADD